MDKRKPKKIDPDLPDTNIEHEARDRPAEPVVTDFKR